MLSVAETLTSNGRTINEWWIRNDVDGSDRGLIWGTLPVFENSSLLGCYVEYLSKQFETFSKNRSAFGTSGSVCPTIQCVIPGDLNLQQRRCEKLASDFAFAWRGWVMFVKSRQRPSAGWHLNSGPPEYECVVRYSTSCWFVNRVMRLTLNFCTKLLFARDVHVFADLKTQTSPY
jgi:hypothetical protein